MHPLLHIKAITKNTIEIKLDSPEYEVILPVSLKKLVKKEYPLTVASNWVPPG